MSTSLDRIASGSFEDGESVGRGTGCASVRTSGSVGALAGNRQGHPARRTLTHLAEVNRRVGPTRRTALEETASEAPTRASKCDAIFSRRTQTDSRRSPQDLAFGVAATCAERFRPNRPRSCRPSESTESASRTRLRPPMLRRNMRFRPRTVRPVSLGAKNGKK